MLIWNGIVKNEAAVIDRCVNSLLPHVDGAIVVDTGSTDGTDQRIKQLFTAAGKPVLIAYKPFENFAQARNEALRIARESTMGWDYALLADADMSLKVSDLNWVKQLNGGLSYDLYQTAGSVRYANRRILSRRAGSIYKCPTHEYLDVGTDGVIDGAEFIDHADGANRPEKFQRDIELLETFLKTETDPGLIQRAHFYLAQTYFDMGQWHKAAEHYRIRTTLGGFDEEVWNAQLHYAHCLGNIGDRTGFLWEMLQAYHLRPGRAESLFDLARYFRERGDNALSLLFSEAGLRIPFPQHDQLFVNTYVYTAGLKEEFSICAYYDKTKRARGAEICNDLALKGSEQARNNLFWYLKPLHATVPSFQPNRIPFEPPEGWAAMNPSVINRDGKPVVLVRTVNYSITPEGVYAIRGSEGSYGRDHPIHTRNYLVHLSDDGLTLESSHELVPPSNWPTVEFDLVRGLEDSRLFEFDGWLWTISTVRELNPTGWCEQVLAPLSSAGYGELWSKILPQERRHEKNWMPWADKEWFVYRLGTIVDSLGRVIRHHDYDIDVDHISGGSQVIKVDGVNLAVVHEARLIPGREIRYYSHRFAVFDDDGQLVKLSDPFVLHDRQIEFVAGLAYFPDKRQLLLSYGVRDAEAWMASVDVDEILAFIA